MALDKKLLEHLAALARIELHGQAAPKGGEPRPAEAGREEEKFLRDLGAILNHFNELQEIDTVNVTPMSGGTQLANVTREDGVTMGETPREEEARSAADALPERERGFLKVPPVFE